MTSKKQTPIDKGVEAAIALALYELSGAGAHDDQMMRLTIKRQSVPSAWAMKSNMMRAKVERNY